MWNFNCKLAAVFLIGNAVGLADDSLRIRLQDTHAEKSDLWVYNDIPPAIAAAKQQNKPLFVTFRCVPCKDCAAFDADVAQGNERLHAVLKERFVSVRQVEMKDVDLSLFQFDYDLNWAGMFTNADGTVYARYGTQSSEGADAYNSVEGLLQTIKRVLELHERYPLNRAELAGKRGDETVIKSAMELPGIRRRERYAGQTTRQNCIHCHNIHDALHQHALDSGQYSIDLLWKYPLPQSVGLKIDRMSGIRIREVMTDSAAAQAGIQAREEIDLMNGQRITSIADMQWVLHFLPATETQVEIQTSISGKHLLKLADGWKENDFSWRASMWNAPPRFQAWAPPVAAEARTLLGIADDDTALEVRWINRDSSGGMRLLQDGLQEKDVIVAIAGKPLSMNTRQFNAHLKRNYQVGGVLPITVRRGGRTEQLQLQLVE